MIVLSKTYSFTVNPLVDSTTDIESCNSFTYSLFTAEDKVNLDKNLLLEQVVFDILFDKYLKESEKITCNKYANKMRKNSMKQIGLGKALIKKLRAL